MVESEVVLIAVGLSTVAGLVAGWLLRGNRTANRRNGRAEVERLRAELQDAVGLQADKDARIATLEADLEAERTGIVRFEPERRGAGLTRRFG